MMKHQYCKGVPDEITMIILSKLPMQSLLRLKCICKPWKSWISELYKPGGALVFSMREVYGPTSISFISQQLTSSETKTCKESYNVLGSCNGLVLLSVEEHIFLWNPATRFCEKVLQLRSLRQDNELWIVYSGGLCFDSSANDYKVLLFLRPQSPNYGYDLALISSLKGKRWRHIECPYHIESLCVPDWVSMHGRLHSRAWVDKKLDKSKGRAGSHNRLIYLDIVSEKFDMFPIPDVVSEKFDMFPIPVVVSEKFDQFSIWPENAIVSLGILHECLCMAYMDIGKDLEIWIMKEYGIKKSWTSLFVIRNSLFASVNFEITCSYSSTAKPLFMTENGELIFWISYNGIVAYDPTNDNMRYIILPLERARMMRGFITAITFAESLISPQEYQWNDDQHRELADIQT